MTRLDKKRHSKAQFRQQALSIVTPFYESARAKLDAGGTEAELSEKERAALVVIADDERWEQAELVEKKLAAGTLKAPLSAEDRRSLEWKASRHRALKSTQDAAEPRLSKSDLVAKNKWLQSVLLSASHGSPERSDLSWKSAPDASAELTLSFDDWDVACTAGDLRRLDATLRKSVVALEEGVVAVKFTPKLCPRKLTLHAGAADIVLQYIDGARKAGARRLSAAYSEAVISEFLFRILGARTTGGEYACRFGPCAEDERPLGGADMIVTMPSPEASAEAGRMVIISVARAVSFGDVKQMELVPMNKAEIQQMMPKKLNKLHEQEVIGMSKLAAIVCPDQESCDLVKLVYEEERRADPQRWSTVAMLCLVVDWEASGVPNPSFCYCLGSVNYHTDEMWTPGQLKPLAGARGDQGCKAILYQAELFGIPY